MRMLLLVAAGFVASAPLGATQPLKLRPGMGGVADIGALQCVTFNEIYRWGPVGWRQSVLTWAEGYLYAKTGGTIDEVLAAAPPAPKAWTFDSLTDVVVDHCRQSPDDWIPAAVEALWLQLRPPGG